MSGSGPSELRQESRVRARPRLAFLVLSLRLWVRTQYDAQTSVARSSCPPSTMRPPTR